MIVYLKVSHQRKTHFSGDYWFQQRSLSAGKYYRYYEPMTLHSHIPGSNVYSYSVALEPDTHQPSGSWNGSKIDPPIELNLTFPVASEYTPMNFWFTQQPATALAATAVFDAPPQPIGISTVSSSLGGPSHDLKGPFPEPKFVVSPWINSSIEPDFDFDIKSML